jgi:AcrR family transcriptional regulator
MRILTEKPDTKRPAIARAATSLFARKSIDANSMRDIADGAGVREAAIYRHFEGKEQLAREIFLRWYGWYCAEPERIIDGSDRTVNNCAKSWFTNFRPRPITQKHSFISARTKRDSRANFPAKSKARVESSPRSLRPGKSAES